VRITQVVVEITVEITIINDVSPRDYCRLSPFVPPRTRRNSSCDDLYISIEIILLRTGGGTLGYTEFFTLLVVWGGYG